MPKRALLLCGLGLAIAAGAAAQAPYEAPPIDEAGRLLPPDQLRGDAWEIEPGVTAEGFLYRFGVVTPSGRFAADGLADLPVRLREASALAVLAERSAGEVAAESAGDAVEGTVASVVKVVEEPGETAKGAADGVGRWAKRTLLGARKLAHDVDEAVDDARSEEPPADDEEASTDEGSAAGRAAKGVSKWVLGYSGARRDYAAKLGVDPYTRNPLLAAELDRVAWSASAARFGTGMAMPNLPVAPQLEGAYALVWARHPGDIEVQNRKLATEWGVDRQTRDRFFWSDAWTPTEQTALVQAIESLGPTPGKRTLLEAAATIEEPGDVARFVADAQLLARLHAAGRPLSRVEAEERLVYAWGEEGGLLPLAVDVLYWTDALDARLRQAADRLAREREGERRLLAIAGRASDRAREALAAAGWELLAPAP